MIFGRSLTTKFIPAILAVCVAASLAFGMPAGKSKSRKPAAGKAAKVGKTGGKKSGRQVAKSSPRGRSNKKGRVSARASKRGGRAVAGRGKSRNSRWRNKEVTTARRPPAPRTQSFPVGANAGSLRPPTYSTTTASGTPTLRSGEPAVASGPSATPADVASPPLPGQPVPAPIITNPLVLAYASSLEARGFSYENQGFIVTTPGGEVLAEHNADRPYNPASVVKLMTSLAALSKLGADYRFRTALYTDGTLDQATGTLRGSLYVIGGGDPVFYYENAMLIADKLNRSGIREVEGDLVVLGQFYFNHNWGARERAARSFRDTLTPDTWNAGARAAYQKFLSMRLLEQQQAGRAAQIYPPSLRVTGETLTDPAISLGSLTKIAEHTSVPLVRVLKIINDYSNNSMAHLIGGLVGGTDAVEYILRNQVGLTQEEVSLATTSGLGANQCTPRATIMILRKLAAFLQKEGLSFEDLMPVAGIDEGTLKKRFTDVYRGAVVAKTGTLSGVSALAGVMRTRGRGPLLFVIYNRGGSSASFRVAQDETLKKIMTFYGGPSPLAYSPNTRPFVSHATPAAAGATAAGQR